MRKPGSVLVLITLAAGCAAQPLPAPTPAVVQRAGPQVLTPPPASPAAAVRRVASLVEITGEWDIVSFDGHSPPRLDSDGQRHAYVNILPHALHFSISCNHSGMQGRIDGGVLHPAPRGESAQTAMGCGREREARDEAFFRFFRSRPQVAVLPGGRLRLSSPGHELVLERS
ncbi:MAG TPA: hypothetical protein VF699_05980, partial [Caulobacteraceae bacterium]